jgi:hypothetical protein
VATVKTGIRIGLCERLKAVSDGMRHLLSGLSAISSGNGSLSLARSKEENFASLCDSREAGGFGDGVPVVAAAEEVLRKILIGLLGGELVRPGDAVGGVGSGAGVAELAIEGGLLVGGIVPVVPAGGVEGGGKAMDFAPGALGSLGTVGSKLTVTLLSMMT